MGKIKDIYCIHHSHLDIGYTHPQALLLELQREYIDDAIELCLKTKDYPKEAQFKWTCEATLPVMKWLRTASDEKISIFKELVKKGQISITALMMHTTPLMNTQQMFEVLSAKRELEQLLDIKITTAINHDVNGQPWSFGQALLNVGIEFYLTGINIHFGGIPFKRPDAFYWEMPDGQSLLTYLGEHYSLFSQFFYTYENDTRKMHEGITDYIKRLEESGYEQEFLVLTATNPPLFDNNCPDFALANLIRDYNQEGHDYTVHFATPEMIYHKVRTSWKGKIAEYSGDWTDYWNFGAGSTARETALNKKIRIVLNKAQFLETVNGPGNSGYEEVKNKAHLLNNLFNEHTWGAAQSVTEPDSMETYAQYVQKMQMAYKSASLSAYLLGNQFDEFAANKKQSEGAEGIVLVNTSPVKLSHTLNIPDATFEKGRRLKALRIKSFLPFEDQSGENYGTVELEPFSSKVLPLSELKKEKPSELLCVSEGKIETPYYIFEYDLQTGRILKLYDKEQSWDCLDPDHPYSFFEMVRETIDESKNPADRGTFFPRDIELGNKNISVWNHQWQAKRQGITKLLGLSVEKKGETCVWHAEYEDAGILRLEQEITFYANKKEIQLSAVLDKEPIRTPEALYFAFPLNLRQGWKSTFDSGDMFVDLDSQQLGAVCRDWVTIDKTVSVYDQQHGCCLASATAPLVQIGDFHFGKEQKSILRKPNPLLLSWVTNNYWDTNFSVDQGGKMAFHYIFCPFGNFNKMFAYRMGVLASDPVIQNECVAPGQKERKIYDLQAEHSILLFLKPSENKKGILLALRNIGGKEEMVRFHLEEQKMRKACVVTGLGEHIAPLEVGPNTIAIQLCPNEMKCVYMEVEDLSI